MNVTRTVAPPEEATKREGKRTSTELSHHLPPLRRRLPSTPPTTLPAIGDAYGYVKPSNDCLNKAAAAAVAAFVSSKRRRCNDDDDVNDSDDDNNDKDDDDDDIVDRPSNEANAMPRDSTRDDAAFKDSDDAASKRRRDDDDDDEYDERLSPDNVEITECELDLETCSLEEYLDCIPQYREIFDQMTNMLPEAFSNHMRDQFAELPHGCRGLFMQQVAEILKETETTGGATAEEEKEAVEEDSSIPVHKI
jgi:hypothetical protein